MYIDISQAETKRFAVKLAWLARLRLKIIFGSCWFESGRTLTHMRWVERYIEISAERYYVKSARSG